jgi:hypothetical protein
MTKHDHERDGFCGVDRSGARLFGPILLGLLLALPAAAADQPSQAWRSRHQSAVSEVVLRHQVGVHIQRFPDTACVCVALRSSPGAQPAAPPAAFLRRFAREAVPVRPPAACRSEGERLIAVASSRPAVSVTVGPIYWEAQERVSVDTSFHRDGESEGADSYTLALQKGVWVVVATAHRWVGPDPAKPGEGPAGALK